MNRLTKILYSLTLITLWSKKISGEMNEKIVGGDYANIQDFPHSAFMSIECKTRNGVRTWLCGSSIVNQKILLSAAHCFEDCLSKGNVMVVVGSADRERGITYLGKKYKMHENYDSDTIENDISLILLNKNLMFGPKVKRIILMKNPPYKEDALVAGWGLINEIYPTGTTRLKYARQNYVSREYCMDKLDSSIPVGTICAGRLNTKDYPSGGDSGSALIVRNTIQIGIVSYKNPVKARNLAVYTDTGYHYNWILKTSRDLYCYF